MSQSSKEGAGRLEDLWHGEFGDAYTDRNAAASNGREPFWKDILGSISCERVLEVGCNLGANLHWLARLLPPRGVFGIDVNEGALVRVRAGIPGVNAVWSKARELPFRDGYFDLTFTCGVLIHQPPEALGDVMSEILRCSRRYVLAAEYFSETPTEVPYRGQTGALFKNDFGGLYQKMSPKLRLLRKGFLSKADGWDDVTWWLFEKGS